MQTTRDAILVLCTGNSARSQMAEGLLRRAAGDRFDIFSAGTKPSSLRAEAIAVMAEIGIDISGQRSKSVNEFIGRPFRYVITVCDNARESVRFSRRKRSASTGVSRIPPRSRARSRSAQPHSAASAIGLPSGSKDSSPDPLTTRLRLSCRGIGHDAAAGRLRGSGDPAARAGRMGPVRRVIT